MLNAITKGYVLRKTPLKDRQNINPAWKAEVRTHNGDIPAIVKKISENEIIIECCCALIAEAMTLPVPKPLIVKDEQQGILFGSEELPHPDLKRTHLSTFLVTLSLANWAILPDAVVFDEWIANPDRHGGNLLTDGTGNFWLIDHGLALARGITPEDKVKNYLLDIASGLADDDLKKQRLLKRISVKLPTEHHIPQAGNLPAEQQHMLKFLDQRHPRLFALLRKTVLNHDEIPGF